jgi:hypothetical protein
MNAINEAFEDSYVSQGREDSSRSAIFLPPLFRFIVELTTWVWLFLAGFWYLTIASALALGIFNFPGDKKIEAIAVPGWFRIAVEIISGSVGVFAAWLLFGNLAILQLILVISAFLLDRERWQWMLGRREIAPDYVKIIHGK